MNNGYYYDGTKLLSLKDSNGKKPEVYVCTGNRTSGKTTYFNRYMINAYLRGSGKFVILNRFNYELDDIADSFFKDIQTLFFPDAEFKSVKKAKGKYQVLFLNGNCCGYALALNDADAIKKYSHVFADAKRIIFDEFQSETNHYCDREVEKFISIHTSIARGHGKMVRYVPVYMISNTVTILNPYYVSMGISDAIRNNTKYLKRPGLVLEQNNNENALNAQKESGFNSVFATSKYVAYSSENVYLNDNYAFIETITGKNHYMCTFKVDGKDYAIRCYDELGIVYVSKNIDYSYPLKISASTQDFNINYVMLQNNKTFIDNLRYLFSKGCFRFKSLDCKNATMSLLSY